MIFLSLLTVLMLFIYKKTSNQSGIKEAKNLIKGYLLEIRLFKMILEYFGACKDCFLPICATWPIISSHCW